MTNNLNRFIALSSFIGYSMFLISCSSKKNIDIEYDGHIYIKTTLNDSVTGNFVYDTGAPEMIIDNSFKNKNKLVFIKEEDTRMNGIGNETKNVKVISDTINYKIDGRKKKSKKTFLIDLKSILGQKADGILGFKTFENRAHKIDYINKKIFFTKSHKNYEVLKMILKDDKLYIPINYIVEKKEYNGNFILDLGSSVTILNSSNKIKIDYGSEFEAIGGVGGKTKGRTIFIDELKFGNLSIYKYPVDISSDKNGALSKNNYDGILGNDILDDFDIIIDFNEKILYLKPNIKNNKHKQYFYKSFSYVNRTNIDRSWLVSYIFINTDAYKKGLRLNDKIISINGTSVEQINHLEFYKNLKINQELELTINRDGKTFNINFVLDKFLDGN